MTAYSPKQLGHPVDMFTPEARSEVMSRIRSADTAPELAVRRYLHGRGLRFRLHCPDLPGKPDLVFPRYKVVVYVHGCFWHGHDCKDGRRPKTNVGYWNAKLDRNARRDAELDGQLISLGWKRLIIWGCESRHPDALKRLALAIAS